MGEICFTETSVDFQQTTRRYIPEDSTLNLLFPALHINSESMKAEIKNFALWPSASSKTRICLGWCILTVCERKGKKEEQYFLNLYFILEK
jgi:hypothetical protein